MKETAFIEKVTLKEVTIPYETPFQISGGTSFSRKSIIIELHSGGFVGYGESAPFESPFYSSETISTVVCILKEILIPRIERREVLSIEHFNELINGQVVGNNFAKAGLETAYWDLIAKQNGVSLASLIDKKLHFYETTPAYLARNEYVLSGVSLGIPKNRDLKLLEKDIITSLEKGYRRIKIKICPGWDIEPLAMAKKIVPQDVFLWPDANSSYDYYEHREILHQIDALGCTFIEQPLQSDDIVYHTKLQKEMATPICFDESLTSSFIAQSIIEIAGPKIWNIKLQRVGGLLEAIKIYALASQHEVQVWGGTMPETGVGASTMLPLSQLAGFVYPSCIEASERWFGSGQDLIEIEIDSAGQIAVYQGVGIPSLNQDNYEKFSTGI